jgi:hypothetical protein
MMKLSKRIRDLVRANLTTSARFSGLGKAKSPGQLEAQLDLIHKSLAQAAVRESQVQDELALAEREGRERDAVRLRRELADLTESTGELQRTLDLIEARIEMEREHHREGNESLPEVEEAPLAAEKSEPSHGSLAEKDGEPGLNARRARLAAPEEKREPGEDANSL